MMLSFMTCQSMNRIKTETIPLSFLFGIVIIFSMEIQQSQAGSSSYPLYHHQQQQQQQQHQQQHRPMIATVKPVNSFVHAATAAGAAADDYTFKSVLLVRGGTTASDNANADATAAADGSTSTGKTKSKKKTKKISSGSKKKKRMSSSGSVKRKLKTKTSKDDDNNNNNSTNSSSSSSSSNTNKDGKQAIQRAMVQDSAKVLGDAIRSRAEELRSEHPLLDRIDQSVYSVGWALGATDYYSRPRQHLSRSTSSGTSEETETQLAAAAVEEDDGGVEGSPTAVLVSYFLKSHGGAHALQCICSLLASSAAMASLVVPSKSRMQLVLLKRTMMFAMIKHVSGLLGASVVAAKAIPNVGLRKARVWMEQLARDPVSQYVFYTACMLLWLSSINNNTPSTAPFAGIVLSAERFPWIPFVIVGPILLREVVSTMLVISDVLVLWVTSSTCNESGGEDDSVINSTAQTMQMILAMSQKPINIIMCLLFTPSRWQAADSATRQELLAKLTSKVSLSLEIVVGLVMLADIVGRMVQFLFGTASGVKPSFLSVVQRLICVRLYLQFLWVRRRKISRLATKIRGGSARLPFYVLDVLLDPRAAMGLQSTRESTTLKPQNTKTMTWKDYAMMAFGLDD